jgi:hypothetical protein
MKVVVQHHHYQQQQGHVADEVRYTEVQHDYAAPVPAGNCSKCRTLQSPSQIHCRSHGLSDGIKE